MTLRESLGAVYSLDGEVMGGLRGGAWWFVASCESNQAKAVAQSMSDTLRNASRHQRRLWMEGAGRLVRARFHIQQESCLARAMHHARVATVQGKLQSVGDESSAYLESPGEEFDEWLESVLSSGLCTVVLHHD